MAQQFKEGSLGARLLEELAGTQTEAAFEAAGETAFREYYALDFIGDLDGKQRDAKLREILGNELADKIIAANDIVYGMKIPLHNHYIAWARSKFDVEPKF